MTDRFIPTRNSFILTSINVWTKVNDWTEWQSVWQTSNYFDLAVSSIEIDYDLVERFHNAAREGDVSLVKSMLQEGVPVDCVDRVDQTALFRAASYNRTHVIRLFLQKGADVNKQNRYGNTPVHHAAMMNSIKAIAMLIEHGASINITNNKGYKPIDWARGNGNEAAVRMLEQLGKRFWNVNNSLLFMFYVGFTRLKCSFDWWSEFVWINMHFLKNISCVFVNVHLRKDGNVSLFEFVYIFQCF